MAHWPPLTLGCGVQPLRGKEMGSQRELAHQRNRFRNCYRLRLTRPFTFPGAGYAGGVCAVTAL